MRTWTCANQSIPILPGSLLKKGTLKMQVSTIRLWLCFDPFQVHSAYHLSMKRLANDPRAKFAGHVWFALGWWQGLLQSFGA